MAKKLTCPPINRQTAAAGWCWMLFYLLALPSLLYRLNESLPRRLTDTALNGLFYFINFVAILLIFGSFLRQSLRHALKRPRALVKAVIIGLCGYTLGTWAVTQAAYLIVPEFSNANNEAIIRMGKNGWLLMTLGTVLFAPVAEECLFRGLLFRRIYPEKPAAAWALSMLAFAAIHVTGYLGSVPALTLLLCFLQYLTAGAALAWAYTAADTIWAPIALHCLINAWSAWQFLLP